MSNFLVTLPNKSSISLTPKAKNNGSATFSNNIFTGKVAALNTDDDLETIFSVNSASPLSSLAAFSADFAAFAADSVSLRSLKSARFFLNSLGNCFALLYKSKFANVPLPPASATDSANFCVVAPENLVRVSIKGALYLYKYFVPTIPTNVGNNTPATVDAGVLCIALKTDKILPVCDASV